MAFVSGARVSGLLDGWVALAFSAFLLLCVPTSPLLSRRILINGSLVIGWVPLLWWVTLPFGIDARMAPLVVAVSGALAAWIGVSPDPGRRVRLMVPQLAFIDVAPFAAAAATAWLTWPLLTSPGGDRTLNLLIKSGWDHAPHFAMVHVIASLGRATPGQPLAPDGSDWMGAHYPEHFHTTVVALAELFAGSNPRNPSGEVLMYGLGISLVQVLLACLLAAGVAQLPALRSNPIIGLPLAAIVVATFVVGPGAVALTAGFPNFIYAAATASLILPLSATVSGFSSVRLAALTGLVVATAHGWALLAPLAAAGAALALLAAFPEWPWPKTRRQAISGALVLLAGVGGCLAALWVLVGSGAAEALTMGGSPEYSMSLLVLCGGAAIVTVAAALPSHTRPWTDPFLWGLLAGVLTGVVMVVGLATYQLLSAGALSYYFGKLVTGISLVSVAVVAVAVDRRLLVAPPGPRAGRLATAAMAVVGTVAAFQVYGYVGPQPSTPLSGSAPLVSYRDGARVLMAGPSGEAQHLLSAAAVISDRPFGETVYIAALPGDPLPALADQWAHALSLDWTTRSAPQFTTVNDGGELTGPRQVARLVTDLVERFPACDVVMAPELGDKVRPLLAPRLRARVLGW